MNRVEARYVPADSPKPSPQERRPYATFAVLRTPLLPAELLDQLEACVRPRAGAFDDATDAMAEDRQRLVRVLLQEMDNPLVARAVRLASPDLYEAVRAGRDAAAGLPEKTASPLFSMVLRMCSRPTPFGLLAGISVLDVGDDTAVQLRGQSSYRARHRLDFGYLTALEWQLVKDDRLRQSLRFVPNESVTLSPGRVSYVADREVPGGRRYDLVTLEDSSPLRRVLRDADGGARPRELAARLVAEGVDADEATSFVEELIAERLLVPLARPGILAVDPAIEMAAHLEEDGVLDVAGRLRSAATLCQSFGTFEQDAGSDLTALARDAPPVESARQVHVDLVKPVEHGRLSHRLVSMVAAGVTMLHRVGPAAGADALARFRASFLERYGERSVRLLEAIDPDRGIGFDDDGIPSAPAPGPLLEGMAFGSEPRHGEAFTRRDAALLRLLHRAWAGRHKEIEPTEEDLRAMEASKPLPLPPTMAARIHLLGDPSAAHPRFLLLGASGPSSLRLFSRFAYLDETLARRVREEEEYEREAYAPALVAEVIYSPEGREGNVVVRTTHREGELAVLGHGGAGTERLSLHSLWIRVDAEGHLRLISEDSGREVLPRATTAHNPKAAGSIVYRFLCELQHQGFSTDVLWSWGLFESAPFLPRVRKGTLVVSRARWNLDAERVRTIGRASVPNVREMFDGLRDAHPLPRRVGLMNGEDTLPIDLDNPLALELVRRHARTHRQLRFEELLPSSGEHSVRGPEGSFVSEVILPLRFPATPRGPLPNILTNVPRATRAPTPGSNWGYAKIYLPQNLADAFLLSVAAPFVRRMTMQRLIEGWFFVRYADPAPHVRLRWRLRDAGWSDTARDLNRRVERWRYRAAVDKIQFDTYDRELERYGGPRALQAMEEFFSADSDLVLSALHTVHASEAIEELRWRLALHGLHDLLQCLLPEPRGRLATIRRVRAQYARALGIQDRHESTLAARSRSLKPELTRLLLSSADGLPCGSAFTERRASALKVAAVLDDLQASGALSESVDEIAVSAAHMFVNRILPSDQVAQEFVLYDYCARALDSLIARDTHRVSVTRVAEKHL